MKTNLFVSVVVPCRNERRALPAFLASLEQQDWPPEQMEVLIADGMSDDGSDQLLKAYSEAHDGRVRLVANPGKIVSTGLNAAIRAARGALILRMDVHAEYARDYIRQCVETLLATGADNVGGAPRVRHDSFRSTLFGAAFNSGFAVGGALSHNVKYDGWADTVCFGCWRKTTLERLGLFDEALVRNQDDELNLRLTRAGGRIWQSVRIVSWYKPRVRLSHLARQYFQYGFWKVAVIRKHRLPASIRHLIPVSFVLVQVLLGGVLIVELASGLNQLHNAAATAWASLVGVYGIATIAASFVTAQRNDWRLFPFLPVIFATYHLSYGIGFLTGLFYWLPGGGTTMAPRTFSNLSR